MTPAPNPTRRAVTAAAALGFAIPRAAWGRAGRQTAEATFSGENLALVLGYHWGAGRLTYQGRRYDFRMTGLSIVGLAAERLEGKAEVRHLRKVTDFEGYYWGAGASGALILERGTALLRNAKGVEISLHLQGRGLGLTLAAGGAHIVLG